MKKKGTSHIFTMASEKEVEIKTIINSLLVSNPTKSTIQQLWSDFEAIEGYIVPFQKFGFTSFEEYLHSIPDTVKVHGSGPGAEVELVISSKSAHINDMVLKQKKSKKKSRNRTKTNILPRLNTYKHEKNCKSLLPSHSLYAQNHVKTEKLCPSLHQNYRDAEKFQVLQQETPQQHKKNYEINHDLQRIFSKVGESQKENTESQIKISYEKRMPGGISEESQNSCEKYRRKTVDSIGSIRKSSEIPDNITECGQVDYSSKVPITVQQNLLLLIRQFPKGIKCTKLPEEYRQLFQKNILYEDYNYRSLIQMCSDLPKIFHYVEYSSDDYLLFDKSEPIPSSVQKENFSTQHVQEEIVVKTHILDELPTISWSSSSLIPTDIVTMSDEISRFFPADIAVGDILDVTVGEIYDPSKFWIYMTFSGLEELMEDLQIFFSANHSTYCIPEALLEEGLYCVAIYCSEYHRCVIVNMLEAQPNSVRVLFIDYGTVSNISIDAIWFLPKQFEKLPCQAIRARLSNIYPIYENRPWSTLSVATFEKLVTGKVIVAEITRIDEKDHVLEVYLADITDKDHVHYINDVFVKEELALYTDQERKKCVVDSNCIDNVKYIHLYPEFYEIESGTAPTTEEMKYIAANKIPLHHFLPQYFDIYYNEDINAIQLDYESRKQKKILNINIPTEKQIEEFDFSFFPEKILPRIKDLYKQNYNINKENFQFVVSKESQDIESETNQSVTEYFCNKKRLSELMYGYIGKTESCDNSLTSISRSSDQKNFEPIEEIMTINKSFQRLSTSDSDCCTETTSPSPASTNPFINKSNVNRNPFRSTNPFLNNSEEIVNKSELLDLFAKFSDDTQSQRFVNNLKDSHTCICKVDKQVNIDKANTSFESASENNTSAVNVASQTTSITSEIESTTVVPRIRTPPGFQQHLTSNVSSFTPYTQQLNYFPTNNNPYYQRMPFPQFNASAFVPQNPMGTYLNVPFMENYYNNLNQFNQNSFNSVAPGIQTRFPYPDLNSYLPR